jgi:hypothetical protein
MGTKEREYVITMNSEEGWLFGGETMGILDRTDEKRYEYKGLTN